MIGIIDYNVGNLRSLGRALERLDVPYGWVRLPEELATYNKIILPGVGAFKPAIDQLTQKGFPNALKEALSSGTVTLLGICLGMQLLYNSSTEGGEAKGLGLINGTVERLPRRLGYRVPHIGWRHINHLPQSQLFRELPDAPVFYFAHSYFCKTYDSLSVLGQANYGSLIDIAIESNNVFGVQFHPEKSQRVGLKVLENFSNL
jgi:imidazole glycerol-phosphate synthase subunit HisH